MLHIMCTHVRQCDKYAYVHPYGKAFGINAGAFHSVLLCDPFCVALVDENNERWNSVNGKSSLHIEILLY